MDILPVGTKIFRAFDEAIYRKNQSSYDPKSPVAWVSESGNKIFVSDVAIQTNFKMYRNLTLPL
jgi:hypothetical protein